ncbi:MAG: hypothetical protein OHK0046_00790 [Anaerolineae bacterium]
MRRLLVLLLLVFVTGMVLIAQNDDTPEAEEDDISFLIEAEIGRALPRKIIYEPVNERFAVVDAYNRLLLVDALTYETEHILYTRGSYNDLAFSNDGRWLALAIDTRIELFDAETGELVADLVDLGQARAVVGPLAFSRDDNLLKFEGVYPAPRSIRLSENDTVNVPWLWNLTAARNEGVSTFPREVEAWQFFDYRNGFAIGPEDRIVAALPGRLQVLDAYSLDVLFEIPTERYERDPLNVWFSFLDEQIYVYSPNSGTLLQVDTLAGVLVEIPLNRWLSENDLEQVGGIELSDQARIIGPTNSRRQNDLLRVLLGDGYTTGDSNFARRALTVTLIDLIIPPAQTGDNITALLYVYSENTREGYFYISRNAQQMALSPDQNQLVLRRSEGEEYVMTYDLDTGQRINRFIPALRGIGGYNRAQKNRVLAFNDDGTVILSDFQRADAETAAILAEDLRYSRRFDRFYWTNDSQNVVTISGSEWRLWDVNTGEVVRREVLSLRGSIIATSNDGFRFLTRYSAANGVEGVQVLDLNDNTDRSIDFTRIPGSSVDRIMPDEMWERFFITYTVNSYGQYAPGNQIAMYSLDDGLLWFIAGDDLPPTDFREYGWVDDETVFVIGEGPTGSLPGRVFGVDYAANGLPQCVVESFPENIDRWLNLWERLVVRVRPDALHNLAQLLCDDLPESPAEVEQLLLPTRTPIPATPTPIVIPGVPVCLTARYPSRAQEYAQTWRELTEGLSPEQIAETETLLCEGIGQIFNDPVSGQYIDLTMMIDAATGERASGSFTRIPRTNRPIEPVLREFERTEKRSLGQAVLSPDEQYVASSSLPGELIIYGFVRPYQSLLDDITATAVVNLQQQNLIGVLPSPTPTFNVVGTPRPTLTPTFTPTPLPRPDQRVDQARFGEQENFCPSETLFTLDNLPFAYNPIGRLLAPVQGDDLWVIDPLTGRRAPDETLPACGVELNCEYSPDRSWILVRTLNEVFVVRPDGADLRVIFGEPTDDNPDLQRPPGYLVWSGGNTLEYETYIEVERNGQRFQVRALQRDILGVFPDPAPWVPEIFINEIPASLVSRQPGGPWAVAYTTYSTGIGPGYKYYLYNTETREYIFFARIGDNTGQLTVNWSALGEAMYYFYPTLSGASPVWYKVDMATLEGRLLQSLRTGKRSNDGRFVAYSTSSRTQPFAIYDWETGLTRTYCIPETGARTFSGTITWSPDNRYVALQTRLPKDEDVEGVGQHTLILDVETGYVVDLTTGVGNLVDWSLEPGSYGGEQ